MGADTPGRPTSGVHVNPAGRPHRESRDRTGAVAHNERARSGYAGACDEEAWGMDGSSGISEDAPYRDPKVPKRLVPLAHQSIRLHLLPGERVLGMFSSMRMRRSITLLVVTDVRLLTLGDEHVGLPVVDEVLRADVTEVSIEREKVFSVGMVTARTRHGDVNLGTLNYGKQTFLKLEEILALPTSGAMPVIPTSGPSGRAGGEWLEDGPAGAAPETPRSAHPLVVHLTALADLHQRGALTDEEFTAAKARLLIDPEG